ncbi:MAG: OsmC family protein [Candidatus Dormibacteria bacterium]
MIQDQGAERYRLRVDYESGDKFQIAIRQHSIPVDQPTADGGEDTAPTPTDLFIGSLAACVAYYVRRFLSRHGHQVEGLAVISEVDFASQPHRVGAINLRVEVPGELSPEQQASLLAVASRCTVHNSLRQPPEVRIGVAQLTR